MKRVRQRGGVLLKTLGFSIALTLVFTLVANMLPQVEGEAPVDEEVDLGALTMDSFIVLGEQIFKGKGTCTLCHNNLGRAPDLLVIDAVLAARERMADERYQGDAKNDADYFLESMVDPGRYVVAGFGKKGSNDTESPMPAVDKAPISMSQVEMDAVIAFLQSKDGHEVTVALPSEEAVAEAVPPPDSGASAAAAPKPAATAEEALGKFGCAACHTVLGTESPVGPKLTDVGARLSEEKIRESIVNPMAEISEGFPPIMPPTFAEQMTVKELELIVTYLAQQK